MGVLEHNNRLDYGKSLMPDEGWETSWAIGTTYSLDLEVLLSVPLALFHAEYLSETTSENNLRADMLDALVKVHDKMFVFVHENNITAKCGYSMLMGFLDQNIWNIPLDSPNKNFHPKVWLIRYARQTSKDEYKYRLVTMSRNMTSATDFDIAVAMDSYHTESSHAANEPLTVMITALMERTGRKEIVKQIKKELCHIKFIPPYPFNRKGKGAMFWPHTFRNLQSPLLQDKEYDDLMVISPFIDDDTLEMLSKRCKGCRPKLVSREYEMDRCKPETLQKWDCYMWNSMLEDAGAYEEDETGNNASVSHGISLHAKIFIAKASYGSDRAKYNNWFIGSMNCTQAGFRSNYEAQVHLKSLESGTSVGDVLATLQNPDAPLITAYKIKGQSSRNAEENIKEQRNRKILYELSRLHFSGTVKECPDGKYTTTVQTDSVVWNSFWRKYPDIKVTMRLFASTTDTERWNLKDEYKHSFPNQLCQQLSSFMKVNVHFSKDEEKEFLIQIPISIPEERQGKIMSEILDSEEKLMRYLMFCLDAKMDKEQQKIGKELPKHVLNGNEDATWRQYSIPIYERLLLAASRNTATLRDVRDNVERLRKAKDKEGNPLLSKEFLNMWNLFAIYAK